MKRTKRKQPTSERRPRAAKKDGIVAELKKVNERQLRQVAGGQAEIICCWINGCYCGCR